MGSSQFSPGVAYRVTEQGPGAVEVTISVDAALTHRLYRYCLTHYKAHIQKPGFPQGAVPWEYVERNYRVSALKHVETVMLHAFVLDSLLLALRTRALVSIGVPELISTIVNPDGPTEYTFACRIAPIAVKNGWRQLHFRCPARKNYRDIDNQVKSFIQEELDRKQGDVPNSTQPLDWVHLKLALVDQGATDGEPLLTTQAWMKIGTEEADMDARTLLLDRSAESSFVAKTRFLQDYFDETSEIPYQFSIAIQQHIPHRYLCLEQLRHQFKLRSLKDVHRKLIEVFSFRHDISQHREIADAALRTLLKDHLFSIPPDVIEAEMSRLHEEVHANPDYYVYKSKDDFNDQLRKLAHKQLKEAALIDAIAHSERIEVQPHDIVAYLNLLKRPRTQELVYFRLPSTKVREQEFPLSSSIIEQTCRREKTLNHVISVLSRA